MSRPAPDRDDPDRVLRSPARMAFLAALVLLTVIGALLVLVGSIAPVDEAASREAAPIVFGALLAVFGGSVALLVTAPRRRLPLPAATAAAGGVLLPIRPSRRAAGTVAALAVAGLGACIAVVATSGAVRVLGVAIALLGLSLVVAAARPTPAVRLDPAGVTVPRGRHSTTIAWEDLHTITAFSGWTPALALTSRSGQGAGVWLLPQAWPPGAIVATLDHFRRPEHRDERAGLTDPAALRPFRE